MRWDPPAANPRIHIKKIISLNFNQNILKITYFLLFNGSTLAEYIYALDWTRLKICKNSVSPSRTDLADCPNSLDSNYKVTCYIYDMGKDFLDIRHVLRREHKCKGPKLSRFFLTWLGIRPWYFKIMDPDQSSEKLFSLEYIS